MEGMQCGGCSNSLRSALVNTEGVSDARVSHEDGIAEVTHSLTDTQIENVIRSAGYQPVGKSG